MGNAATGYVCHYLYGIEKATMGIWPDLKHCFGPKEVRLAMVDFSKIANLK